MLAVRPAMLVASLLLLALAVLGAVDVIVFHHLKERLAHGVETRAEAWAHVAKAPVYAVLFLVVPNLALRGAWAWALLGWLVVDVAVAGWDLALEPAARRSRGGVSGGEYVLHVVLSVLAGATLATIAHAAWPHLGGETTVHVAHDVPLGVRGLLAFFAVGTLLVAGLEVAALTGAGARADLRRIVDAVVRPPPVHVAVELPMDRMDLWRVLADHEAQPRWDHRFSRIALRPGGAGGTELDYETRIAGLVLRGWGRVALERAGRQSTFLFGSAQRWNPILRGSGVWLLSDGPCGVRFATSYTYDVRWGLIGRALDRVVLRWWFQRETERSFRRLARELGHHRPVEGARGRKPAARAAASRLAAA